MKKSKSEGYLENRAAPPILSSNVAKNVSQYRRNALEGEIEQGLYRDGSSNNNPNINGPTRMGNVVSSIGLKKTAQVTSTTASGSTGGQWGGARGDTVRQGPEVYSPLWLNSNLNLPRDRATINAWCRSFYALNPLVHNAINLHSTYPISKLNIRCHNKKVEKFFNEMIEEIDLMNICVQIAQEYWLLGESFIYAELDEQNAKWSRLLIQNPDYIVVKKSVIASEPIIMLRPDENLKNIVKSNKASDMEQKKQLGPHIVEYVKRGQNIPLDNFYVSHLARRISPYEIRGTGMPVSIFRNLMLMDKLRECYSEDTEVLTDQGFKTIDQLVHKTTNLMHNPNYVNGAALDENGNLSSILAMKEDFKVACFNPDNSEIEYHKPIELHMSQYAGKMIHFKSRNMNALVSPNHKMFLQKKNRLDGEAGWNAWAKVPAQEIIPTRTYRFRALASWQGQDQEFVNVLDKQVPIELYLKFLGYLISEGCVSKAASKRKTETCKSYTGSGVITFTQKVTSDCYADMKETLESFAAIFNKHVGNNTRNIPLGNFKNKPNNVWNGYICSNDLYNFLKKEISDHEKCTSHFKRIPRWVLGLKPELLKIILNTLVLGDGSHIENIKSNGFKYYTVSKQLADDVQEMAFKCGYAAGICTNERKNKPSKEYVVGWSDAADGNFPILIPNNNRPKQIQEVDYNGVVWCFEVPTGLFVTRRGGRISIHGNSKFAQADGMINPLTLVKVGSADYKPTPADLESWREIFESAQYDKDFKIFTHEAVTVEKIGSGAGIYDTSGDITQLIKEIFIGLMVPSVLMDGGADTSYANGGVALDVLRQRYMQFRNMLSTWLKRKIFAPISKINEFYDIKDKQKVLIIPEIDWNHMSLFDAGDYITNLVQLSSDPKNKRVSVQTLYRSLGLEFEEEVRKIRKEDIQDEIRLKEQASLKKLPLNQLRTLGDDDEIPEAVDTPVPGENPNEEAAPGGDAGGLPGAGGGGMDLSTPPPPPPPPPAT